MLVDDDGGVEALPGLRVELVDRRDDHDAMVLRGPAHRRDRRPVERVLGESYPHRVAAEGEVWGGEELAKADGVDPRAGGRLDQLEVMVDVRAPYIIEAPSKRP
jgi:hypothetical protein